MLWREGIGDRVDFSAGAVAGRRHVSGFFALDFLCALSFAGGKASSLAFCARTRSLVRTRRDAGICTAENAASTAANVGSQMRPAPSTGRWKNSSHAITSTATARFTWPITCATALVSCPLTVAYHSSQARPTSTTPRSWPYMAGSGCGSCSAPKIDVIGEASRTRPTHSATAASRNRTIRRSAFIILSSCGRPPVPRPPVDSMDQPERPRAPAAVLLAFYLVDDRISRGDSSALPS